MRLLLVADTPGHTVGYSVVARGLRDAGIEVILGGCLLPREIVQLALAEDVQWIGYRIMDGAPDILVARLMEEVERQGADGIQVLVGGIVPLHLIPALEAMGVAGVFTPGSRMAEIVDVLARRRVT
ncbi:MAG: cobalamin B12-binding domain-containing protein [Candidatus Methylomirabilales bacterium]